MRTIAGWVRQALLANHRQDPHLAKRLKLDAIRAAALYDFPTADIHQMLSEIERGRFNQS